MGLAWTPVLVFAWACASSPSGGGEPTEIVVPPTSDGGGERTCPPASTREGCPCSGEGTRVECGTVTEKRPDGRTVCGPGGAVCTGGLWSACQLDGFVAR